MSDNHKANCKKIMDDKRLSVFVNRLVYLAIAFVIGYVIISFTSKFQ